MKKKGAATTPKDRLAELERQMRTMDRENRRLHRHIHTTEQILESVYRSRSWRLTAPLRKAGWYGYLAKTWITFGPGTRPRRVLDTVLNAVSEQHRLHFEAEADRKALHAEPKAQIRYLLVGNPQTATENSQATHAVIELCAAYLRSGQDIRLVRWDAELKACVLVDRQTFIGLGGAPNKSMAYPARRQDRRRVRVRPMSASWLIVADGFEGWSAAAVAEVQAWARSQGLKTGAVIYRAAEADDSLDSLRGFDRLWPVSDAVEEALLDQGLPKAAIQQVSVPRRMPQSDGWDSSWSDLLARIEATGPGAELLIFYWVDTTVSVPVNTGIQRVVRQMARGLIEAGYRLVPVKWGGPDEPLAPVTHDELIHFSRWNGPGVDQWHGWVPPALHSGRGWFIMNELPHNLLKSELQTFRMAAESAGLKTAAVFYDTIPWKMAHLYPESFSAAHLNYMEDLARYDRVLAISDYSRAELMKTLEYEFGLAPSALEHILACSLAAEFPEAESEQAAPARLAEGTVEILCLGTVEPRKNHERLLQAFELARAVSKTPLHLTIVGGSHSFEPDLAVRVRNRVQAAADIDWEEKADDARVKHLYARCDFTIYPSVEEGFGLPILESLWYGKPVVCANFGAMAEVAVGGGCVMVDVADPAAMADAIVALANDAGRLAQLTREAQTRAFRSWTDYTIDAVKKIGLPSAVNRAS